MISRTVLTLTLLPTLAAAQTWPTTDWAVTCTDVTETALADLADLECDHSLATGAASVARFDLQRASAWFEDLGFPAPLVQQTEDGPYRAWISDEISTANDGAWGVYYPSEQEIYLRSDYWISVEAGGTGTGELGMYRSRPGDRTMVHELFHGIQRNYRDASTDGAAYKWLWEGTAEAAEYAYFTAHDPEALPLHPRTGRGLDESLHAPPGCGRSCPGAYRRYFFWSRLGELIGAGGGIDYLLHILEQDLGPDNGLTGLHTGLGFWHDEGLTHYYTQFVADYGKPRALYHDEGHTEDALAFAGTGSYIEAEYTGSVLPIAAHAYDLALPPIGDDELVGVTVRLEGYAESLRLIVNGERYDFPGSDQNRYESLLSGRDEVDTLHVRIANIHARPNRTDEQNYTLRVTLDRGVEPCSERALIAALNRRSPEMRPLVDQAATVRQRMLAIDETESVFMLGSGDMSVNGDAGTVCVSPFGVSDLEWEAERDPDFDAEATMEELVERHIGRVSRESGVSEANIRLLLEGEMATGVTPQQMRAVMASIRAIAAEPQSADPTLSGVYFHVFAPNLVPVIGGGISPDNLRSEGTVVTLHHGVGGWAPNAMASVVVYLPGVQAADIRADGLYPAVAFAHAPDHVGPSLDGPETKVAFYTRWRGDWREYRCGGSEREDFEGEQTTLYGSLEGTVTITAVSPTRVEGAFQLSGSGTEETYRGTLERRDDPECRWRPESEEETRGMPVTISGRFAAPNMRAPLPFAIAGVGRAVPVGQ